MEPALKYDGLDAAIIGMTNRPDDPLVCDLLVYSYDKIIQVMMDESEFTWEEAIEYAEFNIIGAYMGPGTPIIVHSKSAEEIAESDAQAVH